ncbi:MAG: Resolvase, N-terminal:Resolvase helix-turn-helix region [Herminiimonas sp.]|nr:Resolvase, N-terminal:Resolvase helix-turn-helix region [Herminiimonas sp.]
MNHTIYYGRISTTDGQTAATQHEEAVALGIERSCVFIDEGVSGYHVAPMERPRWRDAMHALRRGDVLVVRWLDRISRRYDELAKVMRELMAKGVLVRCTLKHMEFDGAATNAMDMAIRDSLLAFMAAQGEVDYLNRIEMQRRGIDRAKREEPEKYRGRARADDAAKVDAWRCEHGASIAATAEKFGISPATVKRYRAEVRTAASA